SCCEFSQGILPETNKFFPLSSNSYQVSRYVVLIGDDSAKYIPEDSVFKSRGPMPTHIYGGGIFNKDPNCTESCEKYTVDPTYLDTWYELDDKGKNLFVSGRIPCENSQQLSDYIQKVIQYEKAEAGLWKNKVLFFADDSIQGMISDLINHENLVWSCSDVIHNWFSEYIFLNDFVSGENRISNTRDAFFNAVNSGTNWVILSAHGHPSFVTNERVLTATDHIYFNNVQKPVILFSMSCSNAAFYKNIDSSMCKSFLFTQNGGAVAYIGTPNVAYAEPNIKIMQSVCNINDTNPQPSIGKQLALAKQNVNLSDAMNYHIIGDPAIRISRSKPVDVTLSKGNNSIECNIKDSSFVAGYLSWQIRKKKSLPGNLSNVIRDSILYCGNQSVQNQSFTIEIPEGISDSVSFSLYVWNDSVEGRAGLEFNNKSSVWPKNSQMSCTSFKLRILHSRYLQFFFSAPLSSPATIEFYQLDGRQAHKFNIPAGADSFKHEFRNSKCSGTLIVVFRMNHKISGKQLVHFW
ncbi:MAG TPA: C25 family cysteine peptidase, partial [Chitinispirillaceae bacterium]|nr:C25 family cysteine peptidase [Chitinispirillaceae bacterium]